MKTIGTHISNIRGLIKAYSRNPEGYTDEGLYNLFSVSRADIMKQQLDKFKTLSADNWFQICMGLESGKSHNCDCVPDYLDCNILKSTHKFPTVFVGRNMSKLKVRLISGKVVNIVSEDDWFRRKDRETNDYFASIINSYLILWNVPLTLKVILVTGLWIEVLDLAKIPNCDPSGVSTGTCFDVYSSMYPLPEEYTAAVYQGVLKLLNVPLQLPQDQTNDSNEFIKM